MNGNRSEPITGQVCPHVSRRASANSRQLRPRRVRSVQEPCRIVRNNKDQARRRAKDPTRTPERDPAPLGFLQAAAFRATAGSTSPSRGSDRNGRNHRSSRSVRAGLPSRNPACPPFSSRDNREGRRHANPRFLHCRTGCPDLPWRPASGKPLLPWETGRYCQGKRKERLRS